MSPATASPESVDPAIRAELERESVEPRLLSECLAYPTNDWAVALPERLRKAGYRKLAGLIRSDDAGRLRAEHFRLFGSAAACRPDLATYLTANDFQQARHLADLAGFYKAFGLEAPAKRPDDAAVMLEFLAYLRFKKRYAKAMGWEEQGQVTGEAEAELMKTYLRPGLLKFSDTLATTAADGFYRELAAAFAAFAGRRWWAWWR